MAARELNAGEQLVVDRLLGIAGTAAPHPALRVHITDLGSAVIAPVTNLANARSSGPPVATVGFWDSDSVPVFFDLFQDVAGAFAEIEVWKANGTPVVRWPVARQEIVGGDALYAPLTR